MSIPTTAELTKLRDPSQNARLWLSIYNPPTILACRLNNVSAAKGDRSITYDGVTSGSYLNVKSGMTLKVGTTAGGHDKGTVRVRSATSSVLTVAENSHIDWDDNDYLTVINFFEINPVYPRIIQDPSDATKTIWYKDYDVAYTNQNTTLGTFICMGPHYAGFVGDPVYFSASGTYNMNSEALSYHWLFDGDATTGSSVNTPGYITYSTPGHYTAQLTVSGTSSSDVSYRHISIYNRPDSGTNVPILNWELVDMTGSRSQGGYTTSIRIRESIPETMLRDGSLVVIFSDDWYGDMVTRQSIGGSANNRSSIFFVGYVIGGSISYNYRDSYVEFDVGSPTEIMKLAEGFSISVRDGDPTALTEDDPSGWVVLDGLTIRTAIYHYLRWHSTVLLCNDIEYIGGNQLIQYFDADRTSLYDAVDTLMTGAFLGKTVADRQGKIWLELDIWIWPPHFQTGFTLDKRDWIGDPQIEEASTKRVSYLEAGGVVYDGSSYQAVLSAAPGVTPGYRGKIERIQGLALLSQASLNAITGNLFAQMNVKYPSVELSLSASYRNFDIAPQEIHSISLSSSDTARGISFSGLTFYPETLRYTYTSMFERIMTTATFVQIADGPDGDTQAIPVNPVEESSDYSTPGMDLPPIKFPPLPVYPITSGGSGKVEFVLPMIANNSLGAIFDHSSTGYVISGGATDNMGFNLEHTVKRSMKGIFRVPTDFSGNILIQAFLRSYSVGSGDAWVNQFIQHIKYAAGATVETPYGGSPFVYRTLPINCTLVGVPATDAFYLDSGDVVPVTGGEVIVVQFVRSADLAQDTFEYDLLGMGWFVTYG